MSKELKPCPFCGGTRVFIPEEYEQEIDREHDGKRVFYKRYQVFCLWCKVRTKWHSTEAEAITAWNRRAT